MEIVADSQTNSFQQSIDNVLNWASKWQLTLSYMPPFESFIHKTIYNTQTAY